MTQITKILHRLWGTEVLSLNTNILEHGIQLRAKIIKTGQEQIINIDFEDVVTFYWNNDGITGGSSRGDIQKWDYIDLSAIIIKHDKAKINVEILTEDKSHIKNIVSPMMQTATEQA